MATAIQVSVPPKGLTVPPDELSVPVSLGVHKFSRAEFSGDQVKREKVWIEMLTRAMARGTLAAFIGAGCGKAYGLPDWRRLTEQMGSEAQRDIPLPQGLAATDIPTLIGHYKKQLGDKRYWEVVRNALRSRKNPGLQADPYRALLKLKIHRFVTSNYDDLLEEVLLEQKRGFDTPRDSFGPETVDRLAEFVIADPSGRRDLVFHCHGKLDDSQNGNTNWLIVTEEDYQRCYFGHSEDRTAFRHALHLLYSSNPILFIGTGLEDEDLFRPLRAFGAVNHRWRAEQLLFALLPDFTEQHRIESLYERFGIKVITYRLDKPSSGEDLTRALVQLQEHWEIHRRSWLEKPALRKVGKMSPYKYCHFGQQIPYHQRNVERFGDCDIERAMRLLERQDARVLCLQGPGGTGKTWVAHGIYRQKEKTADQTRKVFFWSSYYSGDYLSGLDRLLQFLGSADHAVRSESSSRLERLGKFLNSGEHVLIFDGLERLLRESTEKPGFGIPLNPDIERFLSEICKPHTSKLILTTRLWPDTFEKSSLNGSVIHRYTVKGANPMESKDEDWLPYFFEDDAGRPEIVNLLGGHRYALTMANAWVRNEMTKPETSREEVGRRLQLLLASVSPEHRVSRMIELVVRELKESELKLLDSLSVCMGLIPMDILIACADPKNYQADVAQTLRDRLRDLSLLLSVVNDNNEEVFVIHPIVRGYVFHRRYQARSDELPNFTLPGFTAGGTHVDPGTRDGAEKITNLFVRLSSLVDICVEAEKESRKIAKAEQNDARREQLMTSVVQLRERILTLSRNAFGIIRTRMEANTSARWDRYASWDPGGRPGEDYLRTVLSLGDLIRKVSPELWFAAPKPKSEDALLWEDELAWLYNELGLAYFHRGDVLDALGIWELEHQINSHIDSSSSGGLYLFQSSCNLAAVFIQLGRLEQAETHLHTAEQINARIDDREHGARILGYRGVLQHLRGNFREAEALYQKCLKWLQKINFNQRAMSIFERYYADLLIKLNRIDEAERYILSGRARAEASRYPDIRANYRITTGHKLRVQERVADAMAQYTAALEEAREMGLRSLEADALSELSHLALDLGDTQTAIERALDALQIANELCLGLRQAHGLVVLGRALVRCKNVRLGAAYLRQGKTLAEAQGYWLRAREADEELRKLGQEVLA
ncbi:MAG TPA: SIR2 family protein [Candidatus Angelobacter sp.]|nr:SIR2 family protein [Candidatus Angelobacter sp.]